MAPATTTAGPTPAPLPRRLRVLVVDDDRDTVVTLITLLEGEGHEARAAYSGASAVMVASHFNPDAAFIDIRLPDISGWEVARQIKPDRRASAPFLIAISGVYTKSADKILAQSVGFNHFVSKPYDPPALLALLDPVIWGED